MKNISFPLTAFFTSAHFRLSYIYIHVGNPDGVYICSFPDQIQIASATCKPCRINVDEAGEGDANQFLAAGETPLDIVMQITCWRRTHRLSTADKRVQRLCQVRLRSRTLNPRRQSFACIAAAQRGWKLVLKEITGVLIILMSLHSKPVVYSGCSMNFDLSTRW